MIVLVVGYGNTLCGDDGIGVYVVQQLRERLAHDPAVGFCAVRQLTPELVELISRAQAVIFVDAVVGGTPGQITCQPLMPYATYRVDVFAHHTDVGALLDKADYLYSKRPIAWLYTLAGENFALGDSFSAAVSDSLPDLLDQLAIRITQCTNMESRTTSCKA